MNAQKIAETIVKLIGDGRMTYPLIESVGYWIAQYSTDSEMGNRILAFAHSIISNMEEEYRRIHGL